MTLVTATVVRRKGGMGGEFETLCVMTIPAEALPREGEYIEFLSGDHKGSYGSKVCGISRNYMTYQNHHWEESIRIKVRIEVY